MAGLTKQEQASVYLATGSAHPELGEQIAAEIGIDLGPVERKMHPNGELYVRYEESVRGQDVFIVQPHIPTNEMSVNDAAMELCLLVEAASSSSAREVTAVIPSLGYSRSDRKARGREPIGVRVILDQLAAVGVDRIVAVDMHSRASQAIFRGPFDHLTAQPLLRRAVREELHGYNPDECVVVAADGGAFKLSEHHSKKLGYGPVLPLPKSRDREDSQKITRAAPTESVEGLVCIMFDDILDTGGTLVTAAKSLKDAGAKMVLAAATHGVLSHPALERLQDESIDKVLVTDTHRTQAAAEALNGKLRVVSVAPMIGHAITEIIRNGSVSDIFNDQNHM